MRSPVARQQPGEKAEKRIETESLRAAVAELIKVGVSADIRLAAYQINGILASVARARRGK